MTAVGDEAPSLSVPQGASPHLLMELVECAPDGMLVADRRGRVLLVNRQIEVLLGYRRDELLGQPVELLLPERLRGRHLGHRAAFAATPEPRPMGSGAALPARRKDGTEVPVDISLAPLRGAGEEVVAVVVRDATQRVRVQAELERLALHDALTGLPNRALLIDRLESALARQQRIGGGVGVMFLDVDRLKWVNDTLGHEAGDLMLVAVAERVGGILRPTDTVARIGGDEFVVLVEQVPDRAELEQLASRMLAAVRAPLRVGGRQLAPSVSAGLSFVEHGRVDAAAALREADAAMYGAKRNGRDRFETYGAEEQTAARDVLALYGELRAAVEAGDVDVVYQPVVDLRDDSTWGIEALVRWTSPTVGDVDAQEVVALAERSNLILDLDALVLDRACGFVASLELPTPLRLGVNLSGRHLVDGDLTTYVAHALRHARMSPAGLWIEVTETEELAQAEPESKLRALMDLGVTVAVDDFGKGFSSLSRLRDLPVGIIKLDQAFVPGLESDYKAQAMLSAVVALAGALGVTLIVEGIETAAQRDTVVRLGCVFAQGYHLAPPMSGADLRQHLVRAVPAQRPGR